MFLQESLGHVLTSTGGTRKVSEARNAEGSENKSLGRVKIMKFIFDIFGPTFFFWKFPVGFV